MQPETVGLIAAAIFGSGGIGAIVNAWITKRSADADALATWSTVWHANLDRLEARIEELERDLAEERRHRRMLETLLIESRIPLPPID